MVRQSAQVGAAASGALQFSRVREDSFIGIDARSPENMLPPGYLRDALNTEVYQGIVRKRRGYVGYAGNLPVRVTAVDFNVSEQQICFTLDDAINLLTVRSSPIVVYGRLSTTIPGSPFSPTDAVRYYPDWYQHTRDTFQTGTHTLSILGTTHGLGTADLFVEVAESLSPSSLDNQTVEYDSLSIDQTSQDISIGYTNSTPAAVSVFTYYADESAVTGLSYVSPVTSVAPGAPVTTTILAATHQLENFNVIPKVYKRNPTGGPISSRDLVIPDELTLDPSSGTVTYTVTNSSPSTVDYFVILAAAPAANTKQGALDSGTYTITLDAPTSPFIFPGIYLGDGSSPLQWVVPDQVYYNSVADTISVTFQNTTASDAFTVYWIDGQIRSNQVCVNAADAGDTLTTDGSDSSPQMTLWGLDHSEIYPPDSPSRSGWSNHIDSYRVPGDSRIIAGQGGALYAVREYAEELTPGTSIQGQYRLGAGYPSLFSRISTAVTLAPVFWETGETPSRTRGYVTGDGLGDGSATCTAVSWDSLYGGSVRYDLSIPNMSMLMADDSTPETDVNQIFTVGDQIEAQSMGYSAHNGVFDVVHVESSTDSISIWVSNPDVTGSDWDDGGCAGSVSITTDYLSLSSDSPFIAEDILASDALLSTQVLTIVSSNDVTPAVVLVSGATEVISLAGGTQITGTRTGSVIPVRGVTDTPSVGDFVRGDMVTYSPSPSRPLRTLYVNSMDDVFLTTVVGDGVAAVATLSGSDTSSLSVGMRVLLSRAGVYTGEQTITAIPTDSTFEFSSEETASVSGTAILIGNTLHVGESIEWSDTTSDSNTLIVKRRFIPIEAPDDTWALTPSTRRYYFDSSPSTEQSFIRSTTISDNMYLTNGSDEVVKFDGQSLYRAGLFKWQPGVFIQSDIAAPAISLTTRSLSLSAISVAERRGTITEIDVDHLPIGTPVIITQGAVSVTTTIAGYKTTTTPAYYVLFGDALTGIGAGAATASEYFQYQYYYRLNAVDRNGNTIVSAVSQSSDYSINLTQSAGVYHKLVGFPAWDNYQYSDLYLQIYRTLGNSPGQFYFHTQKRVTFAGADGYIEFTDSLSDSQLTSLDPTSTLRPEAALGIDWEEPLRAKYLTSAGNSLILGNVRDYPQLDIRIRQGNGADVTTANLTGTRFLFRRDQADTATDTNMVDRVAYQFRSTATHTITGISTLPGDFFTLNVVNSLSMGDWIYVYWDTASTPASTNRPITYAGWWQISSRTGVSITVKYTGAGAAPASFPTKITTATLPRDVPVLLGTDGNSSAGLFNRPFPLLQAGTRLALAINATMRMVNLNIFSPNQSAYKPWMVALGGNDTAEAGHLLVRQPRSDSDTMSVTPTTISSTNVSVFVNDLEQEAGDETLASTRLFPSRVLISYRNYPELFHAPTTTLDFESDSAVDVNPSDGQEITGVIPFFGESAFGAAQQSGIVVVFKQQSIYLLDISQKRAGGNALQRIETEGVGCTAPGSIAVTKGGIMFANEAGIYKLSRDLAVEYIGDKMERHWLERVDRTQLDLVQGHHYSVGKQYKLSVPILESDSSSRNSEVFVHDHSSERAGNAMLGVVNRPSGWTRFDNHPATGWCNLSRYAYFCSSTGRLFQVRDTGNDWDFQDDHSGYTFRTQLRANDFGITGARKAVNSISIAYRTNYSSSTSVATATDNKQEYTQVTGVVVTKPGESLTGTGDTSGQDIITVKHATKDHKGVAFSTQLENSQQYQGVEVSAVEYLTSMVGATGGGVKQAVQTGGK